MKALYLHACKKVKKKNLVGCNKNVGAFARNPIKMRKWEEI
jgi:hypothetical protein